MVNKVNKLFLLACRIFDRRAGIYSKADSHDLLAGHL